MKPNAPWVYVAGPYTTGDPVVNTQAAVAAANELLAAGVVPIVPHLTMLWHLISPKPLVEWYEYDNAVLRRCDALLRLPGKSSGADQEAANAVDMGLPVFSTVKGVLNWAKARLGEDA